MPMVKSYDVLKLGYLYGENVKKNRFQRLNRGIFGRIFDKMFEGCPGDDFGHSGTHRVIY